MKSRRTAPRPSSLWRGLALLGTMMMMSRSWTTTKTTAFVPGAASARFSTRPQPSLIIQYASKKNKDDLPDIASMKLGDMRQELESYGISTKAFLEKPEFVEALTKARAEGKQPKKTAKQRSSASTTTSSTKNDSSSSPSSSDNKKTRAERIQEETAKAKLMSVGDLRKELTSRGIKTNAFFEKSEFVKAYADAVVDGVKASAAGSSSRRQEEKYDPSYRDVQMRKLDPSTKRMLQGTVIDIRPK